MAISYMDKALGAIPAADHNAGTAQPGDGAKPGLSAFFAGETITVRTSITVTAAATGDIFVGLPIPARHVPVDATIVTDDIDTGSTLTLTVAQLYQDFTDVVPNTSAITASTIGQTGGVARATVVDFLKLPVTTSTRWVGIKAVAGAAGINAGAVLSLTVSYRPSEA